jgi:hypothetical protein
VDAGCDKKIEAHVAGDVLRGRHIIFLKKLVAPQAAASKFLDALKRKIACYSLFCAHGLRFSSVEGEEYGVIAIPFKNIEQRHVPDVSERYASAWTAGKCTAQSNIYFLLG